MLNSVLVTGENLLFDIGNRVIRIKKNPQLFGTMCKIREGHEPLSSEEKDHWERLQTALQLTEEQDLLHEDTEIVIKDSHLQEIIHARSIRVMLVSPYEIHKISEIMENDSGARVLPILICAEMIYIGPLLTDGNMYKHYVKRIASNNPLLADKIRIAKEAKSTETFYLNRKTLQEQQEKVEQSIGKIIYDTSPNSVFTIEGGIVRQHVLTGLKHSGLYVKDNFDLMSECDDKVGLINGIQTESFQIKGIDIHVAVSTTSDYSIYNPLLFAQSNSGAGFTSNSAQYAAVGESIERLAAGSYTPIMYLSDYESLPGRGPHPSQYVLFSETQYADSNFPYQRFNESTQVRWVEGENLATQERVFLPAALVNLPYRVTENEARISPAISTGLALHGSYEQAVLSGIFEVVERDAFAASWLLKLPPNKLLQIEDYLSNYNSLKDEHLCCRAFDISLNNLFKTLVVTIHDRESGHFMIGAATRFTYEEAVSKAFLEAAQGISYINMLSVKYRGDDFIGNYNRIDTFQKHAAFYSIYPEMRAKVGYFLSGNYSSFREKPGSFQDEPEIYHNMDNPEKLRVAVATLLKAGFNPCVVNMTSKEFQSLGVHAVRVIIPGMQPLHGAHAFRFLDSKRLDRIREDYNWTSTVNPYPHPFP